MSTARTICTVCNYIYDENLGEPRQNIKPSLPFNELPQDWRCPECNSNKEMFQPCSCVNYSVYEQTCAAHGNAENKLISADTTVGQLVAQYPQLACEFEQYGIDYCCGGKISLAEACAKKGLNQNEVISKLAAAIKNKSAVDTDWAKAQLKALVEHIIEVYHEPLRKELPRVMQLAEKVARVHGDHHPEMVQVRDIFADFKTKLELHMQKEEMILFPGIVKMEATGTAMSFGCGGGIEHPIEMMTSEHDEAGEAMAAFRRLTSDYTPPTDACGSFKILLYSLAQIEEQMHQHVHKENNILFPRALAFQKPTVSAR